VRDRRRSSEDQRSAPPGNGSIAGAPVSTPGQPRLLRGREEIAAWVEDVCAREMTHRVEQEVLGDSRAAFAEACRYPDGTNVLCMTVLDVRDGLIASQLAIQAWDE
jgi:hypothetical protein